MSPLSQCFPTMRGQAAEVRYSLRLARVQEKFAS
jgi:hypothetical protein